MGKTIVILGNGFDLDLGWKTSYKDFYKAKERNFKEFDRMKYIQEMVKGEYWYDLEGYIRKSLIEVTQERTEELNYFWRFCRDRLFEYFKLDGKGIFNTDKKSCAYKFLTNITGNSSIITFNYTDPFKQNGLPNRAAEYIHIHGDIESPGFYAEILLGADSYTMDENSIVSGELTLPIIKSHENKYVDKVLHYLKTNKNVIFYGHSLGQTDADYFKSYFEHIISGSITEQNIFLVTKNVESLQQVKDNIKKYGIMYDDLVFSKCDIIPIFTEDGVNCESFQQLLKLI